MLIIKVYKVRSINENDSELCEGFFSIWKTFIGNKYCAYKKPNNALTM